jgi:Fe-S-cluster containining protein
MAKTDTEKNGRALRILFNCTKCPGYCCSYDRIEVTKKDLLRLAKHFKLSYKDAEKRYTKIAWGDRVLRHRKDHIFKTTCQFFDQTERRCTVYEARPDVCRRIHPLRLIRAWPQCKKMRRDAVNHLSPK